MLRRFWVAFEYRGQSKQKRELYIAKYATKNVKMTFEPKLPTKVAFIQNLRTLDRCAFTHCKIGIRRSTATSYKEKSVRK